MVSARACPGSHIQPLRVHFTSLRVSERAISCFGECDAPSGLYLETPLAISRDTTAPPLHLSGSCNACGEGLPLSWSLAAVSGAPLRAPPPPAAPWQKEGVKRSAADDALCPAGPAVLLLRARRFPYRAPRALRLRRPPQQGQPARRQGPAGTSDPGHDAMPACGRGAPCLRVQLAGRSPVIKHREVMRTARIRAGVVCGGPRKRRGGRRARLGTVRPAATRPLRGPGPPLHCGPCRMG